MREPTLLPNSSFFEQTSRLLYFSLYNDIPISSRGRSHYCIACFKMKFPKVSQIIGLKLVKTIIVISMFILEKNCDQRTIVVVQCFDGALYQLTRYCP